MGRVSTGIVVAVDGGGSKTDIVAVDLAGAVVARARVGGSSPHIVGLAESVRRIVGGIRETVGGRPVDAVHVYLSGIDLPVEITEFRTAFAAAAPEHARDLVVANDLFAVLRAGTRAPDAVAVICGSGTNCIGLRGDGARVTYPSLGMISGDWGGGFSLGEWALWFAARAEDGRGDPTALQEGIAGHFGLATILEVTEGIHRRRIARERLLDIVPMIFALADRGDAVAARIIEWQAEEIVTQAVTTISRLERTGRPIPVVIGGGVIASGNRRLLSLIEHGLADRAPSAELTVVSEPPIVGAALLALEGAGADRAALDAAAGALSGTASGSVPVGAGSVAPQTHEEQR